LKEFSAPAVKEVRPQTAAEKQQEDEDYYKGFRSYVVLFWMGCNAALVAIILKSGGVERLSYGGSESGVSDPGVANSTVKTYLLVVLWSVAALSGFKFVGASWYLIHRIVSSSLPFSRPSLSAGQKLTWRQFVR
jgi:chitin synthase